MVTGNPGAPPVDRLNGRDPGAEPETLADRLRAFTETVSNAELARRTGVSRESARRYVAGFEPPASFVAAFCEAFDVDANWLLRGVGDPEPAAGARRVITDASMSRLLAELGRRWDDLEERVDRDAHRTADEPEWAAPMRAAGLPSAIRELFAAEAPAAGGDPARDLSRAAG